MKIIFLAAGQGIRLRPLTQTIPKAMVPFNGKPILEHNIITARACGVNEIIIVDGYLGEVIQYENTKKVRNERFLCTNMASSLFCASGHFGSDTIISYTDILYQPRILKKLISSTKEAVITVDTQWFDLWRARMENPLDDAETLQFDNEFRITEIGNKPQTIREVQGQYMGLLKFSLSQIQSLESFFNAQFDKDHLSITSLLSRWIQQGATLFAVPVQGGWVEIDTLADLKIFETNPKWNSLPNG